jgi:hypothetical protein
MQASKIKNAVKLGFYHSRGWKVFKQIAIVSKEETAISNIDFLQR